MTTKIHALYDADGKPTALMLTAGNASDLCCFDLCCFDELVGSLQAETLIGDKGYDADARVRAVLSQAGKTAVIPPHRNRKAPADYDKALYQERHTIENFFSHLKDYRGS